MLQLKHIFKSYKVGDNITHALDDVTISFRDQEFVARYLRSEWFWKNYHVKRNWRT